MSQTKTVSATKGKDLRTNTDGSNKTGCGNTKNFHVGKSTVGTNRIYHSLVRFPIASGDTSTWQNVGTILSATLVLYSAYDSTMPTPSASEDPTIKVKLLTDDWAEGNNADGVYDVTGDDESDAAGSTSASYIVTKHMNKAHEGLNRIDVTALVKKARTQSSHYGFGLFPQSNSDSSRQWSGASEDYTADTLLRPALEIVYEYGKTTPDAPINLAPSGEVTYDGFHGDFVDIDTTDKLYSDRVQVFGPVRSGTSATSDLITSAAHGLAAGQVVYFLSLTGGDALVVLTPYYVIASGLTSSAFKVSTTSGGSAVNITNAHEALTWGRLLSDSTYVASEADQLAARFNHSPAGLVLARDTDYQWRAMVTDDEAMASAWTALTAFTVGNTAPDAPTLTPATASSYTTTNGLLFSGTFADDDSDPMGGYQVQLSYDSVDFSAAQLAWDTGRVVTPSTATGFAVPYGGDALYAGTFYWRARVWDNHDAESAWSAIHSIIFTEDVESEAGDSGTVLLRKQVPWRIVIKDMTTDGSTPTTGRGPGRQVAVLEDAKSVGASIMYNSPGEMHFTLPKDHPQIGVIEPRRTHYSVQFWTGEAWKETFAGLVWDYDANEDDVIFYGLDYLALYDYVVDERYVSGNADAATPTGSKYVAKTIGHIVRDQIDRARTMTNSPVGFITLPQSEGTLAALLPDTVTVYSTYAPALNFVTGLMDSHRQGTSKMTRVQVRLNTTTGGYEAVFSDAEPVVRDNLRLAYGELVQGYRVIPFGDGWGTRFNAIGRRRDGVAVMYASVTAPGIDESVYGRFMQAQFIDGVSDENDLLRRAGRHAIHNAKFGKQLGLGIRSGYLVPRDGYDVTNAMRVAINDGVVNTDNYGSGYWVCHGIAWEATDQQAQVTTLTLLPRDDTDYGNGDITSASPISPQSEWQVGWEAPDPLEAVSHFFLDQTTGIVYVRDDSDGTYSPLDSPGGLSNPGVPPIPTDLASLPSVFIDADGHVIVRMQVTWTLPS